MSYHCWHTSCVPWCWCYLKSVCKTHKAMQLNTYCCRCASGSYKNFGQTRLQNEPFWKRKKSNFVPSNVGKDVFAQLVANTIRSFHSVNDTWTQFYSDESKMLLPGVICFESAITVLVCPAVLKHFFYLEPCKVNFKCFLARGIVPTMCSVA